MLGPLALGIVLLQGVGPPSEAQQEFHIDGTTVTVQSVLSVSTASHGTLYQVRLQFRSVDKSAELIGIGPLTGSGELTLLLSEPKLAFQQEKKAPVEVALKVTGTAAGAGETVELPTLADFPPGNTYECRYPNEDEQLRVVLKTLGTFFFEGVQSQTLAPPHRVVTRFHYLDVAPPILGKVAVMIEFPAKVGNNHLGFRLSWIALESRIKSPEISEVATDKAVLAAAKDYVQKVIVSLGG
jgi:hypothetical protein